MSATPPDPQPPYRRCMPARAPMANTSNRVPDATRLLEVFPALRGLDASLHARLMQSLAWHRVPRDGELFAAGDPCRAFPLLLSGEIQVMRATPDGHEIELYRVHPGESCIVSTSCLLGSAAYSARGIATGDVVLAALPQDMFDTLIAAHPPFRHYVFGLFAERLAGMMQRVEELAFRSLTRRLAAVLLDAPEGVLAVTHERLAAQIGASREAVSRALKKLEDAGCIALGRGRVTVTDRARLHAEA
ncbi:MAG: Crp/Fnr family transcriptional regulator [Thiobacillus sp.]|nr:Crp/Fnr family transcriptional regulator [Thiobacillus sp.]